MPFPNKITRKFDFGLNINAAANLRWLGSLSAIAKLEMTRTSILIFDAKD
jgi:hypothetical protein